MRLNRLRFGVVGLRYGIEHAKRIASSDRCELVALCDTRKEVGRHWTHELGAEACYADYKNLIRRGDLDAVAISTPNHLHAPMTIESMEEGLHVLVEKPMCISLDEGDEMIEAAKRNGRKLHIGYNTRLTPAHERAKQVIEGEELGRVLYATSVVKAWRPRSYYEESPWRSKWETQGGGILMNPGSHALEAFLWWLGPVKTVLGFCENLCHDVDVEDTASALVKFHSGATLNLMASTALPTSFGRTEIDFAEGALSFEYPGGAFSPKHPSMMMKRKDQEDWQQVQLPHLDRSTTDVQLDLFLDCIEDDSEPAVTPVQGRRAVELALAIYESSKTRRAVDLPL
jgi:predicted dehydrogenase